MNEVYDEEWAENHRRRHAELIARAKKEQEKQLRRRRLVKKYALPALLALAVIIAIPIVISKLLTVREAKEKQKQEEAVKVEETRVIVTPTPTPEPTPEPKHYEYRESADMVFLGGEDMTSKNAILVNVDTGEIEGQVDCRARIVPASMTKVLTVLVAAEHVDDVSDKVTITGEATNWSYVNDCSAVGFSNDEVVTVEDLFYGTILCSGGDAAYQLAMYVAGSQEAFVEMMNDKLKELGISETTHFTNVAGIYDEDHYSTCYDMAVIMNAAIDNDYCRKVLSAHKYTTSLTPEHPEGILISNWFLRRIEDKETGGEVVCAKTGFVDESGCCAVSFSEQNDGTSYIAVTVDAHSNWRCIYDHVDIYLNHTSNSSGTPVDIVQEETDSEASD